MISASFGRNSRAYVREKNRAVRSLRRLGAEHRRFLLRLADEPDAFSGPKLVSTGGGHVIVALHLRDERLGDGAIKALEANW